ELGPELELQPVEGRAILVTHGGEGVVLGMERLGDDLPVRARALPGCPQELEHALARAEVGRPEQAVEPDEAHRSPRTRSSLAQRGGRAKGPGGGPVGARGVEAGKGPAHRGLDALGIPAEGGELVTAALRAALGQGLGAGAEAAGKRAAITPYGENDPAVRAAED